ncbi:MAG: hypothetical protein ACYS8W_04215 [Planctomycetota bacterium]|jgi:hypothetical protein
MRIMKHILPLVIIISLVSFAGCGGKKKDSVKVDSGTGTLPGPTGTGTGPTGTGTYPTGTGTTPTGTGTTSTGTGTNPTGTGTSGTGTGTTPTGTGGETIIPCASGYFASGYYDNVTNTQHDGEIRVDYYRTFDGGELQEHYDEWGWVKFDISGIPSHKRIKKARVFYYTLDFYCENEDPRYWGWCNGFLTTDPQNTPWSNLYVTMHDYAPTSPIYWSVKTTGVGWYPEDGLYNTLPPFVDDINDAIASNRGWVGLKLWGC